MFSAFASSSSAQHPLKKFNWNWRGYDMSYAAEGFGQPMLLIHGFGASAGHWRKNIPVLAAAGYRVYALDLLGFGDSEKPALDYSLELWTAIIHDFWKAHIQEPTIFVGNSIGGLMTLMTLAQYPQTAKAGVVLNCAGSLNHRPEDLPRPLGAAMGVFTKLVSSPLTGPLVFNQVRSRFRIRGALKQVYGNRQAITPELVELLYRPSCDEGAQKVFASVLSGPPGPRPSELLPKIRQPLLILWGETDPWTPISSATLYQELADAPDSTVSFQAIPNTGHCPHDERPEVVNPLILDWCKQL
ncbi:MAG: alpha/beta fold hydrolase [Cyanobacteria bacterium J06632_22]